MTLNQLPPRVPAVIVGLKFSIPGPLRCRLLDLGLTPGAPVSVVRTAPLGDPLQFRIRDYLLVLRLSDCEKIVVGLRSPGKTKGNTVR